LRNRGWPSSVIEIYEIEISNADDNSFSLAVIMYVLLPMPLLFFAGSNSSSLLTESDSG
jgi:hypothetical protein